ncbi:MAG: DUF1320 domain-containing protein [Proteobacteria bacterium]|nr:DUF1320 domain-containing protein [Pseudomonadota bacterium]
MYATQADLVERFGATELAQLSNPGGGGALGAVEIDRALADASAEIDSYLAGRYALPLATVPPVLARLAADIARYRLYDQAAPELVKERYAAAVKLLVALAGGTAQLGLAATDTQPTAAAGAVAVAVRTRPPQFGAALDVYAPAWPGR